MNNLSDYKNQPRLKNFNLNLILTCNYISHTPLVAMPSRPPQPDLYFKLKKCIHIITLER